MLDDLFQDITDFLVSVRREPLPVRRPPTEPDSLFYSYDDDDDSSRAS